MKLRQFLLLSLPVSALIAPQVWADSAGNLLFPVDNQAALARAFALPALGQAGVLDRGQQRWRASLDWTNEFVVDQTADASVLEDGETQRYALDWAKPTCPRMEAMWTIDPPPDRLMAPMAARWVMNGPLRLTSSTSRHPSSE